MGKVATSASPEEKQVDTASAASGKGLRIRQLRKPKALLCDACAFSTTLAWRVIFFPVFHYFSGRGGVPPVFASMDCRSYGPEFSVVSDISGYTLKAYKRKVH